MTKRRKRFIVVDTPGLLLWDNVAPADIAERTGAQGLLESLSPALGKLRKLWVDAGYSGPDSAGSVRQRLPKLQIEVIKRNADVKGFKLAAQALGGRKDVWVVGAASSMGSGLRSDRMQRGRVGRDGSHSGDASPTGVSRPWLTFRKGSENRSFVQFTIHSLRRR